MIKLYKKAIGVKYLVALIIGLCTLLFIFWFVFRANTGNYNLLATIKDFF